MRIKCAAIIDRDGRIYEGKNHSEIIKEIGGTRVTQSMQGFVTECGKFVGRKLAAQIAFEAGQIPEMVKELFSEDLNYTSQRFPRKKENVVTLIKKTIYPSMAHITFNISDHKFEITLGQQITVERYQIQGVESGWEIKIKMGEEEETYTDYVEDPFYAENASLSYFIGQHCLTPKGHMLCPNKEKV